MIGSTLTSHAGVRFARGQLTLSAEAQYQHDENIFSNTSDVEDSIWTFTPSARFERQAGVTTLTANAELAISRFEDNGSEDTEDPSFGINVAYIPSPKTEFQMGLSYARATRANEQVLARVESDDIDFNAEFRHFYSEKLGYTLKGSTDLSDQRTANFSDVDTYSLGIDSLYEFSPKLYFVGGANFSSSSTSSTPGSRVSPDNNDFALDTGVEGDISPKVTGNIRAGYNWRNFDSNSFGAATDSGYILNTNVLWSTTDTTAVRLFATRSFNVSSSDQSYILQQIGLSVENSFYTQGSASLSVSHEDSEFSASGIIPQRNDDAIVLTGRLGWELRPGASVGASFTYRDTDSDLAIADYSRRVWSLTARFSY
ncbi:MAG: hypothetical protein SynsKO_13090 [Synoicihabitans sp.]